MEKMYFFRRQQDHAGKSLTFEVAPYVFDYLEHGERLEVCSVCLVVVPLVALMKDQVASLVA